MRVPVGLAWKVLIGIYVVMGIAMIVLSLQWGLKRELLGVAFLVPATASVVVSRSVLWPLERSTGRMGIDLRASFSLWLVLTTATVMVFTTTLADYQLSPLYYLLLTAACLVVIVQIFSSTDLTRTTYVVLLEIVTLSLLLTYTFQFQFPGPVGNDATYHLGMVDWINGTSHVEGYPGQYSNYPLYHILLDQIGVITGGGAKISMAIMALAEVPFLLLVFATADMLMNRKAAMVAALLAGFAPHVVQGWYMYFPNGFTILFFIICLYLALRRPISRSFQALLVLLFVVIVLTHPMTPAILLAILALLILAARYVGGVKLNANGPTWVVLGGLTLLQWAFSSSGGLTILQSYLNTLESLFPRDLRSSIGGVTMSSAFSLPNVILYDLGLAILIATSMGGAFYLLRKAAVLKAPLPLKDDQRAVALAAVTLLVIPVPYALAAVYPMSQPDRWFPFVETMMCIMAGFAVAHLIGFRVKVSRAALGAVVVCVMVIFMVSTPAANSSNALYSQGMTSRYALIASEDSARFFTYDHSVTELHTSASYLAFIDRALVNARDYYDSSLERYSVNPNDPNTYSEGSVLIRQYDLDTGFSIAKYGYKGQFVEINYANERFNQTLAQMNCVYSSPTVTLYVADG